eukprot:scaffold206878_cov37-Tisochrysis_lutea.AAC.1
MPSVAACVPVSGVMHADQPRRAAERHSHRAGMTTVRSGQQASPVGCARCAFGRQRDAAPKHERVWRDDEHADDG